jgi:hypothetical protein
MHGKLDLVIAAIEAPETVRLSSSAEDVFLFYRLYREGRWVCAVSKRLEGDGFLLTAYLASRLKQGVIVWPK